MEGLGAAVPLKGLPALHGAGVARDEHLQRGVTRQEHQLRGGSQWDVTPISPRVPYSRILPPQRVPVPNPSAQLSLTESMSTLAVGSCRAVAQPSSRRRV